jgi:histidinol-phosphate aminotransferase
VLFPYDSKLLKMAKIDIESLVRPHLLKLKPYSSARDEYKEREGTFLDANENSLGSATNTDYSRYPDPYQSELKSKISSVKSVGIENIFVGNGSDEPIDLIYRLFCEPAKDNVILVPPTYGMYEVSANIHNVEVRKVNLTAEFQLDIPKIVTHIDANTKVIWICSPNNPTGNLIHNDDIVKILNKFSGIVVIDEAYIDFADTKSWTKRLEDFPNLIVLQTLSKAWGMAGIRLGLAFASATILILLNKIKSPYNISQLTQEVAIDALTNANKVNSMVIEIKKNRIGLIDDLKKLSIVEKIYPTDSNFILVKFEEANQVFDFLIDQKIIVRNRSTVVLCEDCLRITVGTDSENQRLIGALKEFKK